MISQLHIDYQFTATLWKYEGKAGWHFCSLPKKLSHEIRASFQKQEEGWGRLKVEVQLKELRWNTSIWYDTKTQLYQLPIKAEIMKRGHLKIGDTLTILLRI